MASSAKLDTLVPTTPPEVKPALPPQAAVWIAMVKQLGLGPFVAGLLGGLFAVYLHAKTDSEEITQQLKAVAEALEKHDKRIEKLEDATVSIDAHNLWVQAALVALSRHEPLPTPTYRTISAP